jgi:hypothetical protein
MAFHALLLRLNFNDVQANAIIEEGIESPEDLCTYTQQDVKGLFKHLSTARTIHAPFGAQHKMQILCYWVEKRSSMGISVDPELFDDDTVVQWGEKMKSASDEDARSKPTIQTQFVTYLGTKTGISKAPLTYVTRETEDPADPEDFDDDHVLEVLMTPHTGDAYKRDNGAVYDELKTLLANSPAYTWIRTHDHLRNGHGAWFALIEHYEGINEQNRIKDAAYANIRNASYAGEHRNWTFEQYYHVHQDAHYDLETYGEHISEN